MVSVTIPEGKTHLSKLVGQAAKGSPFMIVHDYGVPLVNVVAVDLKPCQRLGFLTGEIAVPDDLDRMCEDAINLGARV